MSDLIFTLNAILPLLLPCLLGYIIKRLGWFKVEFFDQASKLVFRVFLPILLFSNIYDSDLSLVNWTLIGFSVAGIITLFFIGMIVAIFFIKDPKQKGVVHQAIFRSNFAFIGLPLAFMLGGATAQAEAAMVAAISIPIFNIFAVITLTVYDKNDKKKVSPKDLLLKILKNPLIIGVFAALIFVGVRLGFDQLFNLSFVVDKNSFIPKTISTLAAVATPLSLFVLGGQFEFQSASKHWKKVALVTVLRLIIAPSLALIIGYFIGLRSASQFAILIALFGTPVAVSSVPMAQSMGQDYELAGQTVVWSNVFSAVTLFVIIIISRTIGIF